MPVFNRKSVSARRFSFGPLLPAEPRRRPAPTRRLPTYRAEALEGRCLLSAVTWTGAANDGLWTNPHNWTGGTGVPGAADNVTIGSGFFTVSIPSGTQSINSLTCVSPLQINGGSLVLAATSSVSTLTISSGTLDGAGNVTVSGALTWSGGTMQGTGKTVSAATGTLSIDTTNHTLARLLESDGTANWTAGNLQMSGGIINNNGSFTFNSAATYQATSFGGPDAFNNAGSLTKLGTGELDFIAPFRSNSYQPVPIAFNNTGKVSVQAGILEIAGMLGTLNGNMSAAAPGTLLIGGGFTFGPGATVTGGGTIEIAGFYNLPPGLLNPTGAVNFISGTITINDAISPTALTIGATVTFNNAVHCSGAVTITGSASFATAESFSALTLSGGSATLDGAGDVTVTGPLVWSGGEMKGTGKTVSAATGTLSMNSADYLDLARVLESDGTATWTGGTITMVGGTLNNNGSFTFDSAATWESDDYYNAGTSSFNNYGSFTKRGTGELDFYLYGGSGAVAFNNAGTVTVQAGALGIKSVPNLSGGTLSGGVWSVFSNSKLKLSGPITTIAANVQLNGAGSAITDPFGVYLLSDLAAISGGATLSLQGGQSLFVAPAGGTLVNHGTVSLGAGSKLSVNGAFTQGADGTSITQLSGPTSASFGQVVATGKATLGGTLQATLGVGYNPAAGQGFAVVTGASVAGSFSAFSGGTTPGGLPLAVEYGAAAATITVNPDAPALLATRIGDGTAQRSAFNSFTLTFSEVVNLAAGALTLDKVTTGGAASTDPHPILTSVDVSAGVTVTNPSADGRTWLVQVLVGGLLDDGFGDFLDGIYAFTLHAANIANGAGGTLAGGDQTASFLKRYGDIDGDGVVGNIDFGQFKNAFAKSGAGNGNTPAFDFDHDGIVGNIDFGKFKVNFGKPQWFLPDGIQHD